MQRVTLVRYTTKPGRADENEALSRRVFDELHDAKIPGLAYALLRDGNEFTHVFLNLEADDATTLTELPAFTAFQKEIADRCEVQPQVTRVASNLVASYGFGSSGAR
jgi:hypothetical protein